MNTNTVSDLVKVIHDINPHINISPEAIAAFVTFVYVLAKALRNKTPIGNTKIGDFLSSWVNFESTQDENKPTQTTTPPIYTPQKSGNGLGQGGTVS